MSDNKTLIIAEAGVNHNGSLDLAKKLAYTAKECGADIVKFQTAKLESLVSKQAKMAEYQQKNIGQEMSQKEMLRQLLLTFNEFEELAEYCQEIGISFLSTPFDVESIEFLNSLGCDLWKVPSGEITNYPYLIKIAQTRKPVILSTGMSRMDEVRECYNLLVQKGTPNITLLHCTTQYPTDYVDVNLNAMVTMKEEFSCPVGYSDHTKGIEIPVAAVAMGACVIEKHFTLDRTMTGPDHKASLEPKEFQQMVSMIRNVESAMGDGVKEPKAVEIPNISVARKSIIAKHSIKRGDVLSEDNLTTKRPGNGLSPMRWNEVVGTVAIRDFEEDELIEV